MLICFASFLSGDWAYSSFHRYVREGKYDAAWDKGPEIDFEDRLYGE